MADNIKINDTDYDVETLPREIQTMIGMYRRWENELVEAKINVAKLENALQNIGTATIKAVESLPKAEAASNEENIVTAGV